jgi:hypothetical protein
MPKPSSQHGSPPEREAVKPGMEEVPAGGLARCPVFAKAVAPQPAELSPENSGQQTAIVRGFYSSLAAL